MQHQFEKDIAYFYEAPQPDTIADHYLEALKQWEVLGMESSDHILESHMLPALTQAYAEVAKQTQREFDVERAARLELSLILSQARNDSFEHIYAIMLDLYQEVFRTNGFNIQKAAMLRTFLYQYKTTVEHENALTEQDKMLMLLMAKISAEELQL